MLAIERLTPRWRQYGERLPPCFVWGARGEAFLQCRCCCKLLLLTYSCFCTPLSGKTLLPSWQHHDRLDTCYRTAQAAVRRRLPASHTERSSTLNGWNNCRRGPRMDAASRLTRLTAHASIAARTVLRLLTSDN
jgi:hypothetical protein